MKKAKHLGFIALSITVGAILIAALAMTSKNYKPTEMVEKIAVSDEEIQQYRDNIGDSMAVKKSILIIFKSEEECREFIDTHGENKNVLTLGMGVIPQMHDENGEQYYNVVGNTIFEPLFDTMADGAYLEYPVEFGGSYCYFKRLSKYDITENEGDLRAFIQSEKAMQKGGEIE